MYKLLALDMDGTVLSNDHTISPYLKEVLNAVKTQVEVLFVTGRHHVAAQPYYQELALTTPTICCNGTYMYDYLNQKVLMENALKKEDALRFHKMAEEAGIKQVLYVADAMLYSDSNPVDYIQQMVHWAQLFPEEQRPRIESTDSFEDAIFSAEYVWKIVLEGLPESLSSLINDHWVQDTFNPEQSWFNRVDCAPAGNSKGNRLSQYLIEKGISPDEVMAVGDNYNDVSMIQLAGLGVAMKNAEPGVKACADKVCETDNNGDGLAKMIEKYFLS
ncbi:Cof-type HAD-IIB family hydrolase [Vibrio salinus]|uniref:Cof-type HAD-IIB family hydrolase n=1 Tax=Vibrio salinus TaxID=2899784 RepID=UPI001E3CA92C|nr:Cof-type HAD-IIB family hydrolase [Vibrio salinus]MCE0496171.1 Cof-type HAD-IIB family hydrolase [Vibrio salinus]